MRGTGLPGELVLSVLHGMRQARLELVLEWWPTLDIDRLFSLGRVGNEQEEKLACHLGMEVRVGSVWSLAPAVHPLKVQGATSSLLNNRPYYGLGWR